MLTLRFSHYLNKKETKKNRSKYHLLVKIFIFTWPEEEKSNTKSKKKSEQTLDLQFQIENHKSYDNIAFHHWYQWNKSAWGNCFIINQPAQELTNCTLEPSNQYFSTTLVSKMNKSNTTKIRPATHCMDLQKNMCKIPCQVI